MKLSIIITTYNMEKYIDETIESVLDKVHKNNKKEIEIIIIDDCSNDGTVKKINEKFKKLEFKNFNVKVNEKNLRYPGKGLNYGLKNATGKFVHMLDGDDIVNSQIYNEIIEKEIEEDILEFSMVFFNKKIKDIFHFQGVKERFTDKFPYKESYEKYGNEIKSYAYGNKIYKKEILKNIKFIEDQSAQDMMFNIKVFSKEPVITYNKEVFLYYRCGLDSISTRLSNRKLYENLDAAKKKLKKFPNTIQKEYEYLFQLVIHSNIDEINENLKLLSKENFVSKMKNEKPNDLYYNNWMKYLIIKSIKEKNSIIIKKLLEIKVIQKKIIQQSDRKVENFYTNPLLQKILLLNLFFEMKKHSNEEYEIKKLIDEINYRDLIEINQNYDNNNLFLLVKNTLINYTKEEFLLMLRKERYPLFVENIEEVIAFLKSYYDPINTKIKYSIICVSFNRPEYIEKTIESYISNQYTASELIIVDNNSDSKVIDIINKKIKNINNIILVEKKDNYMCGGRNYGIEIARGNYISFLDDDDMIVDDYFKQLDSYIVDNSIDLLRFNPIYIDEKDELSSEKYYANILENLKEYTNYKNDVFLDVKNKKNIFSSSAFTLINKRLITENSFCEKIKYEDILFYNEVTISAKIIYKVRNVLYKRRIHQNSIMSIKNKDNANEIYYLYIMYILNMLYYKDLSFEERSYIRYIYNMNLEKRNIVEKLENKKSKEEFLMGIKLDDWESWLSNERNLTGNEKNKIYSKYRRYNF